MLIALSLASIHRGNWAARLLLAGLRWALSGWSVCQGYDRQAQGRWWWNNMPEKWQINFISRPARQSSASGSGRRPVLCLILRRRSPSSAAQAEAESRGAGAACGAVWCPKGSKAFGRRGHAVVVKTRRLTWLSFNMASSVLLTVGGCLACATHGPAELAQQLLCTFSPSPEAAHLRERFVMNKPRLAAG